MTTAALNRQHGRSTVLGKEVFFRLRFNEPREGFSRRGRGRSLHVDGRKTEKAREPIVESGARNLEAESIKGRAESTGGCVKLKTVSEIRRRCDPDTFTVECLSCTEFFVGLGSSGEIETEV